MFSFGFLQYACTLILTKYNYGKNQKNILHFFDIKFGFPCLLIRLMMNTLPNLKCIWNEQAWYYQDNTYPIIFHFFKIYILKPKSNVNFDWYDQKISKLDKLWVLNAFLKQTRVRILYEGKEAIFLLQTQTLIGLEYYCFTCRWKLLYM